MYKYSYSLILLIAALNSSAQTNDSISTGASNANDVYYSFSKGLVKTQPNNDWDLAFEAQGMAATILANHVKGLVVYQSPYSYAKWATFDTTGYKTWKKMYNSPQRWAMGAFNLHTDNLFDLGWGTYEPSTHIVSGDSIFLIKLANGAFKKLIILNLNAGIYNIKYSDVDGTNEKTKAIDKANFKNKNFAYYAFDTDATIDREPLTADWDIVFTKYIEFIPTPYPVGGVWTNKGAKTAEARKVPVTITNFSPFTFTDINSEIGYDWKTYNMPLNKYVITDSLVYFVTNTSNVTTKLVFTGYKGGAAGMYYFTKQNVSASTKFPSLTSNSVYPNPSRGILNIKLSSDNYLSNYIITTISGQIVLSGTENIIDVSSLNSGIHFINLQTDKGVQTLRFTKN